MKLFRTKECSDPECMAGLFIYIDDKGKYWWWYDPITWCEFFEIKPELIPITPSSKLEFLIVTGVVFKPP